MKPLNELIQEMREASAAAYEIDKKTSVVAEFGAEPATIEHIRHRNTSNPQNVQRILDALEEANGLVRALAYNEDCTCTDDYDGSCLNCCARYYLKKHGVKE